MSVSIGPGWSIEGGWTIGPGDYAGQTTTPSVQNVAGSNSTTGFFDTGSWSSLTGVPNLNNVEAGWLVAEIPGATVVSTDSVAQTITITGGVFVNATSYTFTGI
jgi:hypothetical protein